MKKGVVIGLIVVAASVAAVLVRSNSERGFWPTPQPPSAFYPTPPGPGPTPVTNPNSPIKLPELINFDVPFVSQAPDGEWSNPKFQDGCEETSVLMAMHWVRGDMTLTVSEAKTAIIEMSDWEEQKYGNYHDTSTQDTADRLIKEYFDYDKIEVKYDIKVDDIRKALHSGDLVLVPIDGTKIGNPNYTAPGPPEHFMVIKGYDDETKEFITNDPGTRKGKDYRYGYQQMIGSIRDYPTGKKLPITEIRTAMIVVSK